MPSLTLLILRCRDIERSRPFYELLDFTFKKHAHGTGPQHYAAESPAFVFEVYPAKPDEPQDRTALGFSVSDLDESHIRFNAAAYSPDPIKDNPWGRTFIVRDPDFRRIEISASVSPA
jgi:catechol 2,3-dioxygenase-like lactoylglutathione lyase family enzyme